jgi:hypothetical protein
VPKPTLDLRGQLLEPGTVAVRHAGEKVVEVLLRSARSCHGWANRNVVDLALVGGYASIAVGVSLIYLPAGLIVGGLLSSVTSLLTARAGRQAGRR